MKLKKPFSAYMLNGFFVFIRRLYLALQFFYLFFNSF